MSSRSRTSGSILLVGRDVTANLVSMPAKNAGLSADSSVPWLKELMTRTHHTFPGVGEEG
jgi:hypothetical protein